MKPPFRALLIACAAAPYLSFFFLLCVDFLVSPEPQVKNPLDFLVAIPLGTFALILYGIPLLVLASLPALVVRRIRTDAWWPAVLAGAALGAVFGRWVLLEWLVKPPAPALVGALAGSSCGWIYWRIALGGQSAPGSS